MIQLTPQQTVEVLESSGWNTTFCTSFSCFVEGETPESVSGGLPWLPLLTYKPDLQPSLEEPAAFP